jgi:hypothetical protein
MKKKMILPDLHCEEENLSDEDRVGDMTSRGMCSQGCEGLLSNNKAKTCEESREEDNRCEVSGHRFSLVTESCQDYRGTGVLVVWVLFL